MHHQLPKTLARSKKLRRSQNSAERVMWRALRNRKLLGYKFRRQFPIGHFIVDFCCLETHLIVEIDGVTHAGKEGYDKWRERHIEKLGFRFLRFQNQTVYRSLNAVVRTIVEECLRCSHPHPHPGPLSKGKGSTAIPDCKDR
jgi:very-short-patch-repair endonuclease